ncbi:putative leucine-rich repeat-containing protein DDB_G0290503 [Chironomus tepperi]|uniref:putative leucine-rich repeat-containing protein DDB_G0290503 n=1 Tax=Chironomus tepperi TaxID=113505 RepID=UPI00391F4816
MPCNLCKLQFNLFKRKRTCVSCHFYYCGNCLGKRKKNFCIRCEIILISSSQNELMLLKTKDLIFFLQSRKVNISGVVEKEELCNLITNHVNSSSYYETIASNSSSPLDFENYSHQIKQTCQTFFTSITDKIATDLQKTTCFNQASQTKKENVMTQQPKASGSNLSQINNTNHLNCGASTSSSEIMQDGQDENASYIPHLKNNQLLNCECCSDEALAEISEKRQSIFNEENNDLCNNPKKAKIEDTTSDSSFEEVVASIRQCDDDWQFIENEKLNEFGNNNINNKSIQLNLNETFNQKQQSDKTSSCENLVEVVRRKSDNSLLNLKKSFDNVDISTSSNCNGQVTNIKISCKKCGKPKSKITEEIVKLNEQLKSSHRTEKEISTKIKQFMDYLDTKLESTETVRNEINMPIDTSGPSTSVEQNLRINFTNFEKTEASSNEESTQPSCSFNTSKRFITLEDLQSSSDLDYLSVKQLKELLALNRVDFKGCCEKQELKERVQRLWESYANAPSSDRLSTNDLCKICMDAPIECVFLDCGHSVSCISCGKVLNECPICRSYIVRVVRIFKS